MLQPRSWACPFGMFLLLVLGAPAAQALEPSQTFGMYGYDVWHVKQGLPQANVASIAQTPDGYLWLATPRGLVRFDGVRFAWRFTRSLTSIRPRGSTPAVWQVLRCWFRDCTSRGSCGWRLSTPRCWRNATGLHIG
ncbi:MAG TPA: two-component regulator propeller domain-containing protein [Terriglobia bacterium]|nr:two-component regulator propeller domain-containing protein [Terriglobia bacterium]